jgi:hypothetical protein
LRPGCRGIGVTANGQNQTASVGGRVPTAGLTSGGVNGSAVYTQLYLGLFDRSLRKELLILSRRGFTQSLQKRHLKVRRTTLAIVGMGMYHSPQNLHSHRSIPINSTQNLRRTTVARWRTNFGGRGGQRRRTKLHKRRTKQTNDTNKHRALCVC